MPRILIISETWPLPASGLPIAAELRASGYEPVVVTSSPSADEGPSVMRVPTEPPRHSAPLFALRNALFFDSIANPGNYGMLRDTLHLHLQEVLYDAVIIFTPPGIYLKIGHWIARMFGIPVWIELSAPNDAGHRDAFTRWNHRRLRRKYLAAATVVAAARREILQDIVPEDGQLLLLAAQAPGGRQLSDLSGERTYSTDELLRRIIRKKQHS